MKKWILIALATASPATFLSVLSSSSNEEVNSDKPKLSVFSQYTSDQIAKWQKYDARDYNLVTSVKNQGNEGLCWAYSAVATIETSILRQGVGNYTKNTLDISENWFDYSTHNRTPEADKTGLNKQDVYKAKTGVGEFLSYGPYMSTQNISLLPQGDKNNHNRFSEKQIASVTDVLRVRDYSIEEKKKAIVEYGAISFSMELGEAGGSATYYNNNPLPHNSRFGSHACSIVGWDDSISKDRFQPVGATRNGAWIVKNSWGEYPFDKGFLYLSYDSDISDAFVYKLTTTEEYANTYFYDGTNNDGTTGTDKNEYAVIFPSNKSDEDNYEILKAFNIFVEGKAFTVSTKIYLHNEAIKTPVAGKPVQSFDTKFNNPKYTTGIYSIKLPQNIALSKGQYYTIEVKLIKNDENALYIGYTSKSNDVNLTFIRYLNNSWGRENDKVIKIKSFTTTVPKNKYVETPIETPINDNSNVRETNNSQPSNNGESTTAEEATNNDSNNVPNNENHSPEASNTNETNNSTDIDNNDVIDGSSNSSNDEVDGSIANNGAVDNNNANENDPERNNNENNEFVDDNSTSSNDEVDANTTNNTNSQDQNNNSNNIENKEETNIPPSENKELADDSNNTTANNEANIDNSNENKNEGSESVNNPKEDETQPKTDKDVIAKDNNTTTNEPTVNDRNEVSDNTRNNEKVTNEDQDVRSNVSENNNTQSGNNNEVKDNNTENVDLLVDKSNENINENNPSEETINPNTNNNNSNKRSEENTSSNSTEIEKENNSNSNDENQKTEQKSTSKTKYLWFLTLLVVPVVAIIAFLKIRK